MLVSSAPVRADSLHDRAAVARLAQSGIPVCRSAAADLRKNQAYLRTRADDWLKGRNALFVAYEMEKCSLRYESRGIVEMMDLSSQMWVDECHVVRQYLHEPAYEPLPGACRSVS